jgi:hypothetical protein
MADYEATEYGLCPSWALSLGYMGVAAGACLSNWGSAVSSVLFDVKDVFLIMKSMLYLLLLVHLGFATMPLAYVAGCSAEHILDYDCVAYIFTPIVSSLLYCPLTHSYSNYQFFFFGPSIIIINALGKKPNLSSYT